MKRPNESTVADLVARTRKTSGVPPTVVDAVALARVAAVLKSAA